MIKKTKSQAIQDGLWGALIGDAAGVPYEFYHAEHLPLVIDIDMIPPPDHRHAFHHQKVVPGTWSDDGGLMLALNDAVMDVAGPEYPHQWQDQFISNALQWRTGSYTPDGRIFDIGIQTDDALSHLVRERALHLRRPQDRSSACGNGSLMRVLPVAFVAKSAQQVWQLAKLSSEPTHNHPICIVACAIYANVARHLINHQHGSFRTAWTIAQGEIGQIVQIAQNPSFVGAMVETMARASDVPKGTGFVLDTLWSAYHLLEEYDSYKSVIKHAIAMGNDTDTTACVAGGLAGIMHELPDDWMELMRGKEIVNAQFARMRGIGVLE